MRFSKLQQWVMLLSAIPSTLSLSAATPSEPDFAFPKKVIESSGKALDKALKHHDNQGVVQSLIDICIAENSIDKSNAVKTLSAIDSVKTLSSDPTLSAMLSALQERLLTEIYTADRYVYDNRELPSGVLSPDIFLWSGQQFRDSIAKLIDESLENAQALKSCPIGKFSRNISINEDDKVLYPTLFDFIACQAIQNLNSISPYQCFVGRNYFTSAPRFVKLMSGLNPRLNSNNSYVRKILELYSHLLEFHKANVPAFINTDLARLGYINSHIFTYGSDRNKDYAALLRELYDRYIDNEYSCEILIEIIRVGVMTSDNNEAKELVALIDTSLAKYPSGRFSDQLKEMRKTLTQKNVYLSTPQNVYPGEVSEISVTMNNVNHTTVKIYDVSHYDAGLPDDSLANLVPLATFRLTSMGIDPFSDDKKIYYVFPGYGKYRVLATVEGAENINSARVNVTSIMAAKFEDNDSRAILTLDRLSGRALEDVMVSRRDRDKTRVDVGRTDSNGYFDIPESLSGGQYFAAKGEDRYADPFYVSYIGKKDDSDRLRGSFFTSLPIYHQGDSLEWSAIIYTESRNGMIASADKKVTVVLSDVNCQPVDTIDCQSDEYGRVEGSFIIPADRLTGYYTLSIRHDGQHVASASVMVSDYVSPTFFITLSPAENNYPSSGDVTLRGKAATYSGFSLSGVSVKMKLMNVPPFSYFRSGATDNMTFYADTVTADSNGEFTLVVPASVINDSPLPDGLFVADFTVTNSDGESQSATTSFMLTPSYRLELSSYSSNVEAPAVISVPVRVLDYKNDVVDMPLSYTMVRKSDNDTIAEKVALSADRTIPSADLSSGQYEITVSLAGEKADVSSSVTYNVIIYRSTDTGTPVEDMIVWSPMNDNIKLDNSRVFRWNFFANEPLVIHFVAATKSGIVDKGSFDAKSGFNTWDYHVPADTETCKVSFVAVKSNKSICMTYTVTCPPAEAPLRIKTETFRDRITPASEETWTFCVENTDDKALEAAVMMRMYNAALDALNTSPWNFPKFSSYIPLSVSMQDQGISFANTYFTHNYYTNNNLIVPPYFNTYGNSLFENHMRIRGTMRYKMNASMAATEATAVATDMAAPAMALGFDSGSSDNLIVRESATESESIDDTASADIDSENSFSYRDAEAALALFRPMLATDKEGRIKVQFTVPDANTTWRFNTIAFTRSFNSAEFDASVIASKPIMVNPQAPQFVRKGDKVVMNTFVMNASDSDAVVSTTIEIFNTVDGKIIADSKTINSLSAKGSATASCEFSVETDADVIGYRVKSATDRFADGEAGVIPVLPSVTPVIETHPFYIAPSQKKIDMTVAKRTADDRITLEYTENPAWYVVSALPGLLSTDCSTSVQAASSLFSASVAEGLMHDNPEIETYLRTWLESDRSDSTYLSMLERNPDLKIMLLSSTPWIIDAKSETERMTRLALLFDSAEIRKVYDSNIALLSTLLRSDGGIAWMGQSYDSSEWATANVLMLLGRLNQLGYLPSDDRLTDIIDKSLAYLTNRAEYVLAKSPDATFYSYSMIASYFLQRYKESGSRRAVDNTLDNILANWKEGSVTMKATDAILLHRFGKAKEARTILGSIKDFASYSSEKGMWWPSIGQSVCLWRFNTVAATATVLEAFDEITPESPDTDAIRQWLILQKQATDWRESISTSAVIATILKSSGQWLRPADDVDITVGGKSVIPSSVEKTTGYFRTDISRLVNEDSTPISISREKSGSASWGAVYTRAEAKMTEVAESSVDGLSVTKRFLRYAGSTVEEVPTLKVGDKVKVELTIVNDRDMDYVAIDDSRAACFRPVEQLPHPVAMDGIYFYLENRTDRTRIFVDRLPRGRYIISYDLWVTASGSYASGIATLQSQYAPELTAHSSGVRLEVTGD